MPPLDLLAGVAWECGSTPPLAAATPADLARMNLAWLPAVVPGTAAAALVGAGIDPEHHDLDGEDWWFRCRFEGGEGRHRLNIGGIATIADVYLNGELVHHGENMFRSHVIEDLELAPANELAVRCAAIKPWLDQRRARPRWKTYLVDHQNLRFLRTSLLGRMPGWAVTPPPVGLWRSVSLTSCDEPTVVARRLTAVCPDRSGGTGVLEAQLRLRAGETFRAAKSVTLYCGGSSAPASVRLEGADIVVTGEVRVAGAELWWPHTHGPQPLYETELCIDGERISLGRVGFRRIEADRNKGGFALVVNGEKIFTRGACWLPVDPVSMAADGEEVRESLESARRAGMNMVRVLGTGAYESADFFAACDELGILVWHDCMLAFMDPPADESFVDGLSAELSEAFDAMSGHPSLAVVCGSQETEEVAAMNGLPAARRDLPLLDKLIPRLVEASLPSVPYETSCPSGDGMPFRMDNGTSQYFGIGGYLRPLSDARRAGVRFAAECLALSTPPEPFVVDSVCGGATRAGHDPDWKKGVHHDAGRSWDMEDVRDFYVRRLFDVDPLMVRYEDPERALDLGRAANAELMAQVFSEWRTPSSTCDGGLVLALKDLRPGAGWGIVDSFGVPKAPWYALRRVLAPITLVLTDEGLNGIRVHVINDKADPFVGRVELKLYGDGERLVDHATVSIDVPARGSAVVDAGEALTGFRDVAYAFRFGAPQHDVVVAELWSQTGEPVARAFHLPLGHSRPWEDDVGLTVTVGDTGAESGGGPVLEVSTRRFAQWVSIEAPGYLPEDSWFHLAPGTSQAVPLRRMRLRGALAGNVSPGVGGVVRALNSRHMVRFGITDEPSGAG